MKDTSKAKTAKRPKAAARTTRSGTSISQAHSLEDLAEFWDTHDTTDYPLNRVEFEVSATARHHFVAVDPDILSGVRQVAHARGLSTESLVNLWLQERLAVATSRKANKAA
jgi:hypothetical protein